MRWPTPPQKWILSHPALREAITRLRPLFLGEDAQDRA